MGGRRKDSARNVENIYGHLSDRDYRAGTKHRHLTSHMHDAQIIRRAPLREGYSGDDNHRIAGCNVPFRQGEL